MVMNSGLHFIYPLLRTKKPVIKTQNGLQAVAMSPLPGGEALAPNIRSEIVNNNNYIVGILLSIIYSRLNL